MHLLQQQKVSALASLVAGDRRAVRHLVGRLWDPNEEIRAVAAAALGAAATAHPELGVDVVRRLIWGLNDESGTNGVYGVPALGEIGREAPELFEPFVSPLMSFAEDAGLRIPIIEALIRIGERHAELVRSHVGYLRTHIPNDDAAARAALARLDRALGGTSDA